MFKKEIMRNNEIIYRAFVQSDLVPEDFIMKPILLNAGDVRVFAFDISVLGWEGILCCKRDEVLNVIHERIK